MLADKLILALWPVRFITLEDIASDYRYPFNLKQITELMRLKERNGLDKITKKVNHVWYFDKDKFEKWIKEYNKNPHLRAHQVRGKMNPTEEKRVGKYRKKQHDD